MESEEGGQAIIEFLIVSTMILTMIFVFLQLAWAIAYGHYAHYATFMASRAFLSAGSSPQQQAENAATVARRMLKTAGGQDILPSVARARTGGDRDIPNGAEPVPGLNVGFHSSASDQPNSRYFSWAEGVQYSYSVKLFLVPLSSVVAKDGVGKSITPGTAQEPTKSLTWKGAMNFASDSFLGREPNDSECWAFMERMSGSAFGISRQDGAVFIEDNGC